MRSACGVGSRKIRVPPESFERRNQLTDQKSLVIESNEIRAGSVAVHYWKEAVSREMKAMAVDRVEAYRAKMNPERCSSIMIQPSEVEVGRIFKSAQSVRKPVLGVISVKRLTVQEGRFVGDPGDGTIEEMLIELEELDKPHEWTEDDEATIDALLKELELENADQDRGGRSEIRDVKEVPVPCTCLYKVSVECICDVTKATGISETDIKAEGKCCSRNDQLTGGRTQDHCLNPFEDTQQQAALKCR